MVGTGSTLGASSSFALFFDTSKYGMDPVIVCTDGCTPGAGMQSICLGTDGMTVISPPCGAFDASCISTYLQGMQSPPCTSTLSCVPWIKNHCGATPAATSAFGYCVPAAINETFTRAADGAMSNQAWTGAFSSIEKGAYIILGAVLVALASAFAWTKLLQCCAKTITVTAIVAVLAGLVVSGVFLMQHAQKFALTPDYKSNASWQLCYYGSIAILAAAGVYALIILALWKRIMLAVQCVKIAGSAIRDTPTLVVLPVGMFIITCGIGALWLAVAVNLFSVGTIEKIGTGVAKHIVLNRNTQYAFLYHLFGLFWCVRARICVCAVCV